ncbi:hypothetical protein I7I51_01131 [Histoplasma capsulatum]|uniref:Uncharacterized protein n=1 Tax=Ajellomyces capsulatus TaxID=5037 RepID=A0A8A1MDQ5_AJECA|nr:hypothetical protein I7I51_01131 [Histoplasma capsulatum]
MLGTGLMSDAIHENYEFQEQGNATKVAVRSPNAKISQKLPLKGNRQKNRSSSGAKTKPRSWITGMTVEDFRLAVENGATWDQLKELCFEKLRIVIDFRPPVTPMMLATSPTSPVAASTPSGSFQGGVLERGELTSNFGSSFGYTSSATTSWSSAGLVTRGDDGYFTVKKA